LYFNTDKQLLAQQIEPSFIESNQLNTFAVIDSVLFLKENLLNIEYRANSQFFQQLSEATRHEKNIHVFLRRNPENAYKWDIEWNETVKFRIHEDSIVTTFSQVHIDTLFYTRTGYYNQLFVYPESRTLDKHGGSWNWHNNVHLQHYLDDLNTFRSDYQLIEQKEKTKFIELGRNLLDKKSSMYQTRTLYIDPKTWLIKGIKDIYHDLKIDLYHGFEMTFVEYRLNEPFHDSILNPNYFILDGYNYKTVFLSDLEEADSISEESYSTSLSEMQLKTLLNLPIIDLHGNNVFLKHQARKWLVIDFWFYNCTPCLRSIYTLNEAINNGRYMQVQFVGLNGIDRNPKLLQKLHERGIKIPMYLVEREFLRTWEINVFPTYLVYDPDGMFVGAGNSSWLFKLLNQIENRQ